MSDLRVYCANPKTEWADLSVPHVERTCARCGTIVCCDLRDYLCPEWVNTKTREVDLVPSFDAVWCSPCMASYLLDVTRKE